MYFGIKRVCVTEARAWSYSHFTSGEKQIICSFEYAFFDEILYFFLEDMLVLKNAIIRVDVCGARGWFLNEN